MSNELTLADVVPRIHIKDTVDLQRRLLSLEKHGFLRSTSVGNRKLYSVEDLEKLGFEVLRRDKNRIPVTQLMSAIEAADYLGVTRVWVYQMSDHPSDGPIETVLFADHSPRFWLRESVDEYDRQRRSVIH